MPRTRNNTKTGPKQSKHRSNRPFLFGWFEWLLAWTKRQTLKDWSMWWCNIHMLKVWGKGISLVHDAWQFTFKTRLDGLRSANQNWYHQDEKKPVTRVAQTPPSFPPQHGIKTFLCYPHLNQASTEWLKFHLFVQHQNVTVPRSTRLPQPKCHDGEAHSVDGCGQLGNKFRPSWGQPPSCL